jgi:hypothetical protein
LFVVLLGNDTLEARFVGLQVRLETRDDLLQSRLLAGDGPAEEDQDDDVRYAGGWRRHDCGDQAPDSAPPYQRTPPWAWWPMASSAMIVRRGGARRQFTDRFPRDGSDRGAGSRAAGHAGRPGRSCARVFASVFGLVEEPKPANLERRGRVWFTVGSLRLHLGVDADFRPAKKAHPALLVSGLAEVADRCRRAGYPPVADEPLEGFSRVYVADPFGNRIELLEPIV